MRIFSISLAFVSENLATKVRARSSRTAVRRVLAEGNAEDPELREAGDHARRHAALRRERLREHFGLAEAELSALRSPVGLYLASKTPAEIALSIMAEVVGVKNGVGSRGLLPVAQGKAADAGVG